MEIQKDHKPDCKSIFKNGKSEISSAQFTKSYIQIIKTLAAPGRPFPEIKEHDACL